MRENRDQIIFDDMKKILSSDLPWNRLAHKKILVTGGGGFLASHIVKLFLAANDRFQLNLEVLIIIRSMKGVNYRLSTDLSNPNLKIFEIDIAKPIPVDFPKANFLIHCASQASPKYYGLDPVGTLTANTIATHNLLAYATKCDMEKFLFFSSGEVYGTTLDGINKILSETDLGYLDPMQIRSCYGESKRMGENMCVSWSHQFGLDISVVRPFHTYGPGIYLDDGRVFADFVADVVNNRDIILKSDGVTRRPFCYVSDATDAFIRVLLFGGNREAYNVANPFAEISIRELAELLVKIFPERNLKIKTDINQYDDGYLRSPIPSQLPDIQKIEKLGWKPWTSLEDGFRRTVQSFQ